jgi:NAD(P)-dependent dehydrogenase (short-subunit alcohol dehydrogenase family)
MKTILITGANRSDGIGFHAARQLVALGHRVIITARNAEDLKLALARLGPSAHGIALDVKNEEELEALPGQVSKITDTLDVLVNNAGILLDSRMSALNVTKKVCEEAFLVNSIAPVLIVQRLLPLLTNSTSPHHKRLERRGSTFGQRAHEFCACLQRLESCIERIYSAAHRLSPKIRSK